MFITNLWITPSLRLNTLFFPRISLLFNRSDSFLNNGEPPALLSESASDPLARLFPGYETLADDSSAGVSQTAVPFQQLGRQSIAANLPSRRWVDLSVNHCP
jgi:hypothetical protein